MDEMMMLRVKDREDESLARLYRLNAALAEVDDLHVELEGCRRLLAAALLQRDMARAEAERLRGVITMMTEGA